MKKFALISLSVAALLAGLTGCDPTIHNGDYCSYNDLNRTICDWDDAFTCIYDGYDYVWRADYCSGDETCIETSNYTAACFAYCDRPGDINPDAYVCNGDLLMISQCDFVFDKYNSSSSSPVWTSKTLDSLWIDKSTVMYCSAGRLVTSRVGDRTFDTYCTLDNMIETTVLTVDSYGNPVWVKEYVPSLCSDNYNYIECDPRSRTTVSRSCRGFVCREYNDPVTGYMSAHCN